MSNSKKNDIQDQALKVALAHDRCGLGVSMGVGKTLIGLRYIDYYFKENLDLTVLVVAPATVIKSWKKEMKTFGYKYLASCIVFCTYMSLPKQETRYDLVVLDEAHNLKYTAELYLSKQRKILGLTGTVPRYKTSERGQMMTRFYPIKFEYNIEDAILDNILNDYRIFVHLLPLGTSKDVKVSVKGKYHFYQTEEESYLYWSNIIENEDTEPQAKQIAMVMRMKSMMSFHSKERYAKKVFMDQFICQGKTIVFCNTMEQADYFCGYAYHSNNNKSDKYLEMFINGEIDRLSCVLQLSEGQNVKGLKNGIILHSYGNERKLAQRIGRLLRLNPEETSIIHIMCYENTIDVQWVEDALQAFDDSKIFYIQAHETVFQQ